MVGRVLAALKNRLSPASPINKNTIEKYPVTRELDK
jgi:hypothetical protein